MSRGMNDKTEIRTVKLVQQIGSGLDWNTPQNKQLIAGILELQDADEAKRFLRDLMTPTEIKEFANRLEAAKLLAQDVQYNAITESTGLSSATIARIAKWLGGSLGGYRLVLSRLNPRVKLGLNHHGNHPKIRHGLSLRT